MVIALKFETAKLKMLQIQVIAFTVMDILPRLDILHIGKRFKISCEHKIQVIESATDDARAKLDSFYLVLKSNLIAANTIIQQLESSEGVNLA